MDPGLRHFWHPVARSDEVGASPRRALLAGVPLVLARTGTGELIVLEDRCPHRLAPLSAGAVVGDTLECPYHGWRFDASGRCREIPAVGADGAMPPKARCARPAAVAERYGLVFVALEDPVVALPEVDGYGETDRVRVDVGPYSGHFGAGQLIDNQLDVAHFAFLHRGTFGTPAAARPDPYDVERHGDGFECSMTVPIQAANDPGVARGERPLEQVRTMRYRYVAPLCAELRLDYPARGGSMVVVFFAQPEDERQASLWVSLLFEEPGGMTDGQVAERVAFEERVIGEDLALQARFDRLDLPLDLTVECHLRVDRASVELRRILADVLERATAAGREAAGRGETERSRSGDGMETAPCVRSQP